MTTDREQMLEQAWRHRLPGTKQARPASELFPELGERIERQPEIQVVKSDPRDKLFWVGLVVGSAAGFMCGAAVVWIGG